MANSPKYKKSPEYEKNVFINCPFDYKYSKLFQVIIFTIHSVGLRPRCALETITGENRINKIIRIISESKYGIHDISRTELDKANNLPRFNMPLELGIDLGGKKLGHSFDDKKILILDIEPYRFQKFISDIGGYDPRPHGNRKVEVIQIVSDWLRGELDNPEIPNGKQIYDDYRNFEIDYKEIKKNLPKRPSFLDFSHTVAKWLDEIRKKKI